jgi:integrase
LRAAKGDRVEALHLITAALGLRLGDGLRLRWQYVDLDSGMLRFRQVVRGVGGHLIC